MEYILFTPTLSLDNDLENLRKWQNAAQNSLKDTPLPIKRNTEQKKATRSYFDALAELRASIIAAHGTQIYLAITGSFSEFVRVQELLYRIAEQFPGLAPTESEIAKEEILALSDKEGHELSQGLIISELLAIQEVGEHLMAAMQQPKKESIPLLVQFQQQHNIQFETLALTKKTM